MSLQETPGEEELQETVRRSDERIKGQEIQIAELRERLQEAYEAQIHRTPQNDAKNICGAAAAKMRPICFEIFE